MAAILTQNLMKITPMSEAKYDLSYKGELLEGFYSDFVKADLKNLFKANDDYIDRLFTGAEQTIKRDVDKATAIKFQQAFKKAGAKLIVRPATGHKPVESPAPSSAPSTSQERTYVQASATPPMTGSSLSLRDEPVPNEGADHLVEQHQSPLEAPSQVPSWSVAEPGTVLVPQSFEAPPSVLAPNLEVADVGADLLANKPVDPVPPNLDLSGFDLAEPGADLDTLSIPIAPLEIDISHIKLTD